MIEYYGLLKTLHNAVTNRYKGLIDIIPQLDIIDSYQQTNKRAYIMNDITSTDYWNEINDSAINLIDELMDELDNDLDAVEDVLHDRIHETVDSHTWIIYTYHNAFVVKFSRNYEAYRDVYDNESLGALVAEKGPEGLTLSIAYFAMAEDLIEKCNEILEEKEAEI